MKMAITIMMRWSKFLSAVIAFLICAASVSAQSSLRRYVDAKNGAYANDGLSWTSAKNNLQDAINDLASYMSTNSITEGGEIFVAEGVYYPSESTEEGSTLFSFILSLRQKQLYTVISGTKDSCSDPDHSSPLFDRNLVIISHPHRKYAHSIIINVFFLNVNI